MNDFYLNASGAAITPFLVELLLMRSGLQWEMHLAQALSLELTALRLCTTIEQKEASTVELGPKTQFTLMGIPITTSEDYPRSLIRLMHNGEEVTRIENLGIPIGFEDFANYDAYVISEREKMNKIGYRTACGRTQNGN